jgi:hypothetical protein
MSDRKPPPGIREHHGKYQLRYYGSDGKRTSETFDRLSDAKKRQRAVETDKDRGTWINPQLAQTPFSTLARAYMDSRLDIRDSTRATDESYFRRHVAAVFAHTGIGGIRPTDVQAWVSDLSANLAPRQCGSVIAC